MRVNLSVPFEEKDEAKRLGAWWDPARKVWFIKNVEDLTPFMRWIRDIGRHKPKKEKPAVETKQTNFSLPACDCDVAPWDDCIHTEAALDPIEAEHLRACAGPITLA